MNKEEILAKSRTENKGRTDEMETAVLGKAGSIAAAAGGLVCMLIVLLNLISKNYDPKVSFAAWSVYELMQGALFLVKYVKLRRVHELVLAILYLLVGITVLVFLVYLLFFKAV